MTEDVVAYFNQQTGMNLTPIFDQYLRHTALPDAGTEVRRGRGHGLLPLEGRRAGVRDAGPRRQPRTTGRCIQPTTEWQTMKTPLKKDEFEVATDLYYVNVNKL